MAAHTQTLLIIAIYLIALGIAIRLTSKNRDAKNIGFVMIASGVGTTIGVLVAWLPVPTFIA